MTIVIDPASLVIGIFIGALALFAYIFFMEVR